MEHVRAIIGDRRTMIAIIGVVVVSFFFIDLGTEPVGRSIFYGGICLHWLSMGLPIGSVCTLSIPYRGILAVGAALITAHFIVRFSIPPRVNTKMRRRQSDERGG